MAEVAIKKKINWLYWGLISVLLISGLSATIYFGIRPRPIPKINFSQFESSEKMATALIQRLRLEIQNADLLFLGVIPGSEEDTRLWRHFFKQLLVEKLSYDIFVIESELPYKKEILEFAQEHQIPVEEINFKSDLARIASGVEKMQKFKKRIAFILPSVYVTQTLKESPMNHFKNEIKSNPVSFTLSHFPLTPEEEEKMEIPCAVNNQDSAGTGALGCMILMKAKLNYRKKKTPGLHSGLVDQIGQFEYLILFNSSKNP